MRHAVVIASRMVLILCSSILVLAQTKRDSGTPSSAATNKHHALAATPDTVQWGWLDPKEPPKLTVDSGDTISVETLMHSLDQVQPGVPMEKLVELRKQNDGSGPHSDTDPSNVKSTATGAAMEIGILKILPKAQDLNF